jgi:hypothetical protein
MASYVKFRDVAAVIQAGNSLATAGATVKTAVPGRIGSLEQGQSVALGNGTRDEYNTSFWTGTYAVDGRNTDLFEAARAFAESASRIGPNVVQAATGLLWVDAVSGAAMFRATNPASDA